MRAGIVCIEANGGRVLADTVTDAMVTFNMLPKHTQCVACIKAITVFSCCPFTSPLRTLELSVPPLTLPAFLFIYPAELLCLVLL